MFHYAVFDVAMTPIFDLESPPPEPPRTWLPKLIGAILGALIGSLIVLGSHLP